MAGINMNVEFTTRFCEVKGEHGVRRVDPSSIKFCDEKNAVLCEMSKTP